MTRQFALVFFTQDQLTAIIPEEDITTEYSVGSGHAKCKWPGSKKLHSVKVLYVGTKELCKKKQEKVNKPGELETSERTPSPVNGPSVRDFDKLTQLLKEMLYKTDYLDKKVTRSISDLCDRIDGLESNVNSIVSSLHRIEAKLPTRSLQGRIDYSILSQYEVAKLQQAYHGDPSRFARAVEERIYSKTDDDWLEKVEKRINSAHKMNFLKEVLKYYFKCSEAIFVSTWKDVKRSLNERVRRDLKRKETEEAQQRIEEDLLDATISRNTKRRHIMISDEENSDYEDFMNNCDL